MMELKATPIPYPFDRYTDLVSDLRKELLDPVLPGYPEHKHRWHFPLEKWDEHVQDGVMTVPDGPWNVIDHLKRREAAREGVILDPAIVDDDHPIGPARTAAWRAQGLLVTNHGLPVHPLARLGLTAQLGDNPETGWIGMATGIGQERYWGELISGNLGIRRLGPNGLVEYAMVQANRGGRPKLSFPGGYAERGETAAEACVREGAEETGIVEACEAAGTPWPTVEQLPKKFWRVQPSIGGPCTLNAWLDEQFLMIDATSIPEMAAVKLRTRDSKEIKSVGWVAAHHIRHSKVLGAHRRAFFAHMAGDFNAAA